MNAPSVPEPVGVGVQTGLRHVGRPYARKEDHRLLTGAAGFLDNLQVPGALHACFVRSPFAHARIGAIRTEAAAAVPGVVAVVTGRELAQWTTRLRVAPPIEGLLPTEIETLPTAKARFQGDPVACVVAVDRYVAEDAAERVEVDWEPLEAVTSMEQALAPGAPLVDESIGTNLVSRQSFAAGDVEGAMARAHRVVESRFEQARLTHVPIETRGCLAVWDKGREHLTVHVGTQVPHPYRTQLATRLSLAESQVTVVSPDIGGGFGQKITLYREELVVAALARALGRPVRWREDRIENLTAAAHAREITCRTRAAVDERGRIAALSLDIAEDFGAYTFYPANYMVRVVAMILTGPYRIASYAFEVRVALTNKCGAAPMRAPMAVTSWVMEGTMDAIARELGIDPVEVRRANLLAAEDLPYAMATGEVLEDVTPAQTMEAVLAAIGYEDFRLRQREARASGRLLGLGLCNVIESTTYGSRFYKAAGIPGSGHESAWIRIEPTGAVNASVGLMGSGQGYETPLAQAVAEGLGVTPAQVRVHLGHTDIAPYGMGSRGSRGATAGGGVLYLCALDARAKLLAIAAKLLGGVPAESLRLVDGVVERSVAGPSAGPDGAAWEPAGLTLAQLARTAYLDPLALPDGAGPGLEFVKAYDPPPMTYSNSSHACIVEIDAETGALTVERYVVAEDCGTVLNPLVVEGQQHGAVAMGLGGAVLEQVVYDETGQNLSSTLADYLVPTATDLPAIEVLALNTPSRRTPLGLKGMAEGGVMGAIGAVANAVGDALAPLGVKVERLPLSPENLRALTRAK